MRKEKSCGAVIFRRTSQALFYLLLKYKNEKEYWGLPKGHIEKNETELQTVIREVYEETGLHDLVIYPDFRELISYHPAPHIYKQVVFYLAQTQEEKTCSLCGEHDDFLWLEYPQVLQKMTYEKDATIVKKAHQYIANL
ncbi:MAG TPA: NUDIX domain-containing protein [Caldisericia bacterium]|nr:NUDIX domain-containing protein [Caldisericia bacterium]